MIGRCIPPLAGNLLKMEGSKMGDSSNRFAYHRHNQERAILRVTQNRYNEGKTGRDKWVGIFMLLLSSDHPRINMYQFNTIVRKDFCWNTSLHIHFTWYLAAFTLWCASITIFVVEIFCCRTQFLLLQTWGQVSSAVNPREIGGYLRHLILGFIKLA